MPAAKSNWLDRVYEYVSPARAARRYQARRACDLMRNAGGFDGARRDRTTAAWNARSGAADVWLRDADTLRDRARSLIRNNVYASGALEAIVANVVGCGIVPRPSYQDATQRKVVQDAWIRWCDTCDVTGQHHFYELQALYLRECVEAGECLIQKAMDPAPYLPVPFVLQSVESERLASEWTYYPGRQNAANNLRRGVEVDSQGRPVAYYLWPTPLNDLSPVASTEPIRVDAGQVLHLFRKVRIGQTRGYSWLAPALLWFRDLGTYVENELMASTVSSCFTVAIKTLDGGSGGQFTLAPPSGASGSDGDGNRIDRLQPGLVTHLLPGEDVTPINPGRPNSASEPWINLLLRSIAVGMGLSYELVSRDYSQTNFSSNRASALEDRRRFRPIQKWLVAHLCRPVWREFFEAHVMLGAEGFPDPVAYLGNPEEHLNVHWQTPGWEWVDPLKEAQAAKLEVETGLTSRGEVIAASGRDRDEVFAELARENELLAELGVNVEADRPNDQDRMDAEREEEQTANARE